MKRYAKRRHICKVMWGLLALLVVMIVSVTTYGQEIKEIKVGMSSDFSGPFKELSEGMKLGIETYFKEINDAGGVNGYIIKLIAYDDKYDRDITKKNMDRLINEDNVLAVIGNVGSPTAEMSSYLAGEKHTLLFGALTGAEDLRHQATEYVINYRASYKQEIMEMVQGLRKIGIREDEISFFTQQGEDEAVYEGGIEALKALGYPDAASLSHFSFSLSEYPKSKIMSAVKEGILRIASVTPKPKAVIMVCQYEVCAQFIKEAQKEFPDTYYLHVSFVESLALAKALGTQDAEVIVTQVVPHYESNLSDVSAFPQDLKDYEEPFVALEGYLAARVFVEGLKQAGDDLFQEDIVNARKKLVDALKGLSFSYKVWPTRIKDGQCKSLKWSDLK